MKRRFVLVLIALTVGLGGVGTAPATQPEATPVAAEKRCGRGYVHAIIDRKHKCLRAGQFCARRFDRQYHRYGFHCHTGRLVRR